MGVSDISFLPAELIEVHQKFVAFIDEVKQWEADMKQSDHAWKELHARVRTRSKELAFFYKMQPREFGGRPAGPLEIVMLQETLAASNIGSSNQIFGPPPGLLGGVRGRLREVYLEPLLAGEKTGAFGFTEPDDVPRRTWATLDADKLVVNGQKSYVTGGDTSDFVSCLVNIEDSSRKKLGSAMVIIDCNSQGVSIKRIFNTLDGTSHAYMVFQDVYVPAWHMIGKPGQGLPKAMGQIAGMRLSLSAQCVGWGRWVLDYVNETVSRPHVRRGSPLAEAEGVRLRFADMALDVLAARSLLYHVAQQLSTGKAAKADMQAVKVLSTEMLGRVVDQGLQLCGGMSLQTGHPLEKLYRRARTFRFTEGASDLLRLQLADDILKTQAKL